MLVKIDEIIDFISERTGIDKKDITFRARFDVVNGDVGKYCEESTARYICVREYFEGIQSGLYVSIKAKDVTVLSFNSKEIDPYTNNVNNIMSVGYDLGCVGPGFYSYSPYLHIDKDSNKENIKKFKNIMTFDTEKATIGNIPSERKKNVSLNKDEREVLNKISDDAITKDFFKDLENNLDRQM